MNTLDIGRINRLSPYEVQESCDEGFFDLVTDSGVQYSIGFMENYEALLLEDCYEFIIVNVNNKKSLRDVKLRDAMFAVIDEFFRVNNSTVLYICDTGDGRQSVRNRLFQHWFMQYSKHSAFTFMNSSVFADGIMNYASLIVRNDNPKLQTITEHFTTTVRLLGSKPEWDT